MKKTSSKTISSQFYTPFTLLPARPSMYCIRLLYVSVCVFLKSLACVTFFKQLPTMFFFFSIFDRGSTWLSVPDACTSLSAAHHKDLQAEEMKKGVKKNRNTQWRFCSGDGRQTPSCPHPRAHQCRRCYICIHAHEHDWENDVWWGWGFSGKIANRRDAQWKRFLRFDIDTSYINRKESQKFLIVFCTLRECTYACTFNILSVFYH